MAINTVLGAIDPQDLGPTSMHEHALLDARVWFTPTEDIDPSSKVSIETLGQIRWNVMSVEDNLVLDDPEVALLELTDAKRSGLSGFVDLTCVGIGRRPADLVGLAHRSGLHIMASCGFYIHESHPDWIERASVDEIAHVLVGELDDGIDGTGIRAAIIGEIGTSDPIAPCEERVLRAAARASLATGAAITVHLDGRGAHGLQALRCITDEGLPPSKVVLGHLDERLDIAYHLELAATGAFLAYDTFGAEFCWGDGYSEPTDAVRMDHLSRLVDSGHDGQLVLGCDVWSKGQLKTFGGMGYEHLMKRIAPTLRRRFGIGEESLFRMLVESPRRLLDR
jgi:phosphotriesterase-related protein